MKIWRTSSLVQFTWREKTRGSRSRVKMALSRCQYIRRGCGIMKNGSGNTKWGRQTGSSTRMGSWLAKATWIGLKGRCAQEARSAGTGRWVTHLQRVTILGLSQLSANRCDIYAACQANDFHPLRPQGMVASQPHLFLGKPMPNLLTYNE